MHKPFDVYNSKFNKFHEWLEYILIIQGVIISNELLKTNIKYFILKLLNNKLSNFHPIKRKNIITIECKHSLSLDFLYVYAITLLLKYGY